MYTRFLQTSNCFKFKNLSRHNLNYHSSNIYLIQRNLFIKTQLELIPRKPETSLRANFSIYNSLLFNKNEQKEIQKIENSENKESNNSNQYKRGETPIRKLLRVKDYLDAVLFIVLCTSIYIGYKNYKKKAETEKEFEVKWIQIPRMKHKIFSSDVFYFPEFLLKNLKLFKEFKIRKDDIWVVSFPKSGKYILL